MRLQSSGVPCCRISRMNLPFSSLGWRATPAKYQVQQRTTRSEKMAQTRTTNITLRGNVRIGWHSSWKDMLVTSRVKPPRQYQTPLTLTLALTEYLTVRRKRMTLRRSGCCRQTKRTPSRTECLHTSDPAYGESLLPLYTRSDSPIELGWRRLPLKGSTPLATTVDG